jgi:choline dehydrogenase-like flavoprotein
MFGCPVGAKWTAVEVVEEAIAQGADLLLDTQVTEVLKRNGAACGVQMQRRGQTRRVEAARVILSAGALGSPAILQASGVRGSGESLAVDVFQTLYGFAPDVGMQDEILMAVYLADLLEEHALFLSPFVHVPFLMVRELEGRFPRAMTLIDAARVFFRSRRIGAEHIIGIMTKIRDATFGRVHPDGSVSKALLPDERRMLDEGAAISRELLLAAGVEAATIFSGVTEGVHPCCTTPIGSVVSCDLETEVSGLFVCDAGVFPTPLGVPPLLTVVALARRLSRLLVSA